MGTFNGNTAGGGHFSAPAGKKAKDKKKIGGFGQVLLALALFASLFLLYTFARNMFSQQKSLQWSDLGTISAQNIVSEINKMDEADLENLSEQERETVVSFRQLGVTEVTESFLREHDAEIESLRDLASSQINLRVDRILTIVFACLSILFLILTVVFCKWQRTICVLLALAIIYLVCVFSNIPLIKKYRDMWISTAMSTMRHQGLATFYFPESMCKGNEDDVRRAEEGQIGDNTVDVPREEGQLFADDPIEAMRQAMENAEEGDLFTVDDSFFEMSEDQQRFYARFYELDIASTEAYLKDHPEAVSNGYEHIFINNSALGAGGTSIRTKLGEKVLAIDTDNQILLLEVDAAGSRGVLAIAKDNTKLHLFSATTLPTMGQTAGTIASNNGGILAMTGSGFIDEGGVGMGGEIAGYAMCGGREYGTHLGWGSKRLELHEDNWFYLQDAPSSTGAGTTDAMEFHPGILINGKRIDPGIWTSQNPRACIGQSSRGEILMLCVEGRTLASPGCSIEVCADILVAHDGLNAINCDGGTTAIMWYRGNPVMRCSNAAIPQGRYLPNAWVIVGN